MKALAAAAIAGIALGGLASASTGSTARSEALWLVLASDRDGNGRGYSIRADGKRLTPLLGRSSPLTPAAISDDGGTIAYVSTHSDHPRGIFVSRASGAGLRRVFAGSAFGPVLSRDGRLLAFTTPTRPGVWIVGADGRGLRRLTNRNDSHPAWSPDGKALVLTRAVGESAEAVVVQPLRGRRRVLAWGGSAAASWAPDGRWIAYGGDGAMWLVRPDGTRRHRIARRVGGFDWAPDGKRLAFTTDGAVAIVGVDGRGSRVQPRGVYATALRWSPDGRRLALLADGYPSEVWTMNLDGRRLRRVTTEGSNELVGWTRGRPVRPAARPVPSTERAIGPRTLQARADIVDIGADGSHVALASGTTPTDCHHVAVWTPARRSVVRLPDTPAPCGEVSIRDSFGSVVLAGTRAAWIHSGGGNTIEEHLLTATLARPTELDVASAGRSEAGPGTALDGVAGDGTLLAFTVDDRCSPYQEDSEPCPPARQRSGILSATVYRVGGTQPCPVTWRLPPRACATITKADGRSDVLAVDAGRIALRGERGVRVIAADGSIVRELAVDATAAALSSGRIVLRTADAIAVYNLSSGRLAERFPVSRDVDLADLEGDILVTTSRSTVILRRLGDGRTATFDAAGRAQAQLEPPGLYLAGTRRLTFTPMADVLRRLGG